VIVFSSNRAALDALPGFVETVPLDITGQTRDVERRLPLNLPDEVSMVGEQSVLVQVTIVPVIESITLTREIEIQGLGPDLFAVISPTTVNVILTGPAETLDSLQEEDVRVVLDLLDLDEGTYQLEPQVLVLPTDLEFDAPIPNTIELRITTSPPPTPTASP
jgi:YbbR domain-containing protein